MPALQRDLDIHILEGRELVEEMKHIAEIQGIDLTLADLNKTKQILDSLESSFSDEIIRTRENLD